MYFFCATKHLKSHAFALLCLRCRLSNTRFRLSPTMFFFVHTLQKSGHSPQSRYALKRILTATKKFWLVVLVLDFHPVSLCCKVLARWYTSLLQKDNCTLCTTSTKLSIVFLLKLSKIAPFVYFHTFALPLRPLRLNKGSYFAPFAQKSMISVSLPTLSVEGTLKHPLTPFICGRDPFEGSALI